MICQIFSVAGQIFTGARQTQAWHKVAREVLRCFRSVTRWATRKPGKLILKKIEGNRVKR